jgi:hypothetical protein
MVSRTELDERRSRPIERDESAVRTTWSQARRSTVTVTAPAATTASALVKNASW